MSKRLSILASFFCCLIGYSQSFKLTEAGFKSATKIEDNKGKSLGSGVFYQDSTSIFLISARHVFLKQDGNRNLVKDKNSAPIIQQEIFNVRYYDINNLDFLVNKLEINFKKIIDDPDLVKYNEKNDLIAIKIAVKKIDENKLYFSKHVLNYSAKGFSPLVFDQDWVLNFDDVEYGTDAWIIGYPVALNLANLNQYDFNLPLLQKGIVSGKYEQKRTMIVSAPVFPGNSGGPVLGLKGRGSMKLMGIAVELIPFVEKFSQNSYGGTISQEWANSGYSVIEAFDKVEDLIRK